jgi:hypothetical protein
MNIRTSILIFFLFFFLGSIDVLPQNKTIDGYKGLWFNSGQSSEYGYYFSGGVATYNSRYRPVAIYSPEVKKTFFIYGGTSGSDERHLLIMASYFDHRLHQVPKPVVVYDKMGVREPYDNASISIGPGGFIWVFVSGWGRSRPGLIFRSSKPYSIESFDEIKKCEMISPQPWRMENSGFLLMFSKFAKGHELYFSSSSDGEKWSDAKKLASMGGHFQVSELSGEKLVTVFNYHPGGDMYKQTNIYLLQTEDSGRTWKTIDNKTIETPVTDVKNDALVKDYEAEGKLVYINDLNFDKNGNPVILLVLARDFRPGPNGGPREWVILSRKDNKWNFNKVCESDHNFDMGSLYINGDEWKLIGTTEPGPQKYGSGGEIALWISRDEGVTWEKVSNVTNNSINNNSFVRRPVNENKDFYAFWTDGNTDRISPSMLYFTNDKCNKIWVLPSEMKSSMEKPVRIK